MVEIASNVSDFGLEIVANRPTQLLQCLRKNLVSRFWHRIVARKDVENADDARALARLGLRCHWSGGRPAENTQSCRRPIAS
jgi:hypothetical protein